MAPHVVSKTCFKTFRTSMPQQPYLTFQLRAEKLHSLVIRTWSHDQGWLNPEFRVEDPYANSSTWFLLDVVDDEFGLRESRRAYKDMRCHTKYWAVSQRVKPPYSDEGVFGFLESLEPVRELTVGVFPLGKGLTWLNWVWKMEVELHFKADVDRGPPAADVESSSGSVRIVPSGEAMDIVKSAIPPSLEHSTEKAAALRHILDRQRKQYRRTRDLSDLEDAIALARMAVDIPPAYDWDRPRLLTNLTSLTEERNARVADF